MDKNIEKIIENVPIIQDAWTFTDMVRRGDENGDEAFCKNFTVNQNEGCMKLIFSNHSVY